MLVPTLLASITNYSEAAAMTFGIPIGIFFFALAVAYFQRKPLPDTRRQPLFPLSSIPQRAYDLQLVAALRQRDRDALVADRETRQAVAERPIGE